MQYRFTTWPAVSVASLLLFATPSFTFGHDQYGSSQEVESSFSESLAEKPPSLYAQNFSGSEILTQAERDLIKRVAVNVAIDPATARTARDVTITAEQGTIVLHGPVANEIARDRLVKKIASIPGVMRVEDELQLTSSVTTPMNDSLAGEARMESAPVAPLYPTPAEEAALAREQRLAGEGGFPVTQEKERERTDEEALPGSGSMHEEDRTGTTGPSGSRPTSPLSTGAVDTTGRATKSYSDSAVTTTDRALVSQVRTALAGNPDFPAAEEALHLKADNGTIHLYGWVTSEQARKSLEATVRDQAGVQGVVNHLQVRSAALGTVR